MNKVSLAEVREGVDRMKKSLKNVQGNLLLMEAGLEKLPHGKPLVDAIRKKVQDMRDKVELGETILAAIDKVKSFGESCDCPECRAGKSKKDCACELCRANAS